MAADKENFALSGPFFLTAIDWNNSNHKRSVAASLIQGVYVFESDRRNGRDGCPLALAPPWWKTFGFDLHRVLTDDRGECFAAVYEFNSPYYVGQHPPQYVVAFRGKIAKFDGGRVGKAEDLMTALTCMVKNFKASRSFQIGLEASVDIISRVGQYPGNVWLVGHSIGASLALLIGREMVKSHSAHLETYLFNPPFASLPIEMIKSETLKLGLRLVKTVVTASLAVATGPKTKTQDDKAFDELSSWVPYLFISSSDMICSEYAGYFGHREKMDAIGGRKIGRMAMKHSIRSTASSSLGKKDSEPVHLLPSAFLTINIGGALPNFKEARGIHQWWNPNLELKYKLYNYN